MKIIQISDLHFGKEDSKLIPILLESITALNPDLVLVSGDLTQRAFATQFLAAKNFLDEINFPKLIIPGNHDIPLFNLFKRLLDPFADYRKYISSELHQKYINDEVAILGVNSVFPFSGKNGRLSKEELERIKSFFKINRNLIKILMTHHNFVELPDMHPVLLNKDEILEVLAECQINIVLSGHLHVPYLEKVIMNTPKDHAIYFITAGTAISNRLRNAVNSFNYLEIDKEKFKLEYYFLEDKKFIPHQKNFHPF